RDQREHRDADVPARRPAAAPGPRAGEAPHAGPERRAEAGAERVPAVAVPARGLLALARTRERRPVRVERPSPRSTPAAESEPGGVLLVHVHLLCHSWAIGLACVPSRYIVIVDTTRCGREGRGAGGS